MQSKTFQRKNNKNTVFLMNVITLTSDRISDDFYIGRVKGEIARICPEAHIIDLAHNIPVFNTVYASFIVKHSFANFPDETIHLIGVDSEEGPGQAHLVVRAYNQYFVCADNGLISLIFEPHEISGVYTPTFENETNQPAMIRFTHIAQKLISNRNLLEYLRPLEYYTKKLNSTAVEEEDLLLGKIIYVDSYNNAVTNISKSLFENTQKGRRFVIYAGNMRNKIRRINQTHLDSQHGQLLAMFNSMNLLEIAINKGPVMKTLNLRLYDEIRIEFINSR